MRPDAATATTADRAPRAAAAAPSAVGVAELATVHALTWLVVGNVVGVLLGLLLLAPGLGDRLAPLTYGRWMPVHWNAQLYGWLALPLVALLLRLYLPAPGPAGEGRPRWERWGGLAVTGWSATLLVGCVSWLAGATSGKPFLEWSGPLRWLLVANLAFLAAVLSAGFVREALRAGPHPRFRDPHLWGKAALLVVLLPVPAVMAHAASPATYPPVNPASGGPTGASLLGSTLGIVALFVAAPFLLGAASEAASRRRSRRAMALLAAHGALFLLLDHGDHSHHETIQVAAVASLAVWPPVLFPYLRAFRWPAGAARWLAALGGWGGLLVATAVLTFLPGVLERWKFTNALVAHAHLAMAGLTTSFAVLVLLAVNDRGPLAGAFSGIRPFVLWHGGCVVYVLSMFGLGALEGVDPGVVIRGAPAGTALYAVRLAAGVAMLAASAEWLASSLARVRSGLARISPEPPAATPRPTVSGGGA